MSVKPIKDYTPAPLNAWQAEADRLIWSDIARAVRVADGLASGRPTSLAYLRASLAMAEGEIAKARAQVAFLVDKDTQARARRFINITAACVRAARGV